MTAEGAGASYRLDVSNVSISTYGAILTPTPRTVKVYCTVLLLQCTIYFKDPKKVAVLWVVEPICLVNVYQFFRGNCFLRYQGDVRPDDGGSKYLRSVGKLLSDCEALETQRTPSSY